ncbi:MAG: hypothetical protein IPL92_17955 [Saprospiraceae bacterium]|nr:hypothetical protein [Candidatus Opimibacter iunctus]
MKSLNATFIGLFIFLSNIAYSQKINQNLKSVDGCGLFNVALEQIESPENNDCCYAIRILKKSKGSSLLAAKKIRLYTNQGIIKLSAITPNKWIITNISTSVTSAFLADFAGGIIPLNKDVAVGSICFYEVRTYPFYLKYDLQNAKGQLICTDSLLIEQCGSGCKNNIIQNGNFTQGAIGGSMLQQGKSKYWNIGYGSPLLMLM